MVGSERIQCSRPWTEFTTNTKHFRNSNQVIPLILPVLSSPVPERLLRKRAGQSWSVCPRIFGGVKPFSRGQSPQKWLWYESNRHPPFWPRLASFFGKMQDFMQDNWGLISLMNTGFVLPGRKTDFSKCKILGRFCVLSFEHSTICIVLVENTVVLRVQIQNKGEPKK